MGINEADILKSRIEEKKDYLKREGLPIPEEKELLREAIQEKIEESLRDIPPTVEIQKPHPAPAQQIDYLIPEESNFQEKIKELVEIAFQENIIRAVTTALKTGNAFLIDRFRDTLADKYYYELKKRKLI